MATDVVPTEEGRKESCFKWPFQFDALGHIAIKHILKLLPPKFELAICFVKESQHIRIVFDWEEGFNIHLFLHVKL